MQLLVPPNCSCSWNAANIAAAYSCSWVHCTPPLPPSSALQINWTARSSSVRYYNACHKLQITCLLYSAMCNCIAMCRAKCVNCAADMAVCCLQFTCRGVCIVCSWYSCRRVCSWQSRVHVRHAVQKAAAGKCGEGETDARYKLHSSSSPGSRLPHIQNVCNNNL